MLYAQVAGEAYGEAVGLVFGGELVPPAVAMAHASAGVGEGVRADLVHQSAGGIVHHIGYRHSFPAVRLEHGNENELCVLVAVYVHRAGGADACCEVVAGGVCYAVVQPVVVNLNLQKELVPEKALGVIDEAELVVRRVLEVGIADGGVHGVGVELHVHHIHHCRQSA